MSGCNIPAKLSDKHQIGNILDALCNQFFPYPNHIHVVLPNLDRSNRQDERSRRGALHIATHRLRDLALLDRSAVASGTALTGTEKFSLDDMKRRTSFATYSEFVRTQIGEHQRVDQCVPKALRWRLHGQY